MMNDMLKVAFTNQELSFLKKMGFTGVISPGVLM